MINYNGFLLERLWSGSKKLNEKQFFKLFKENCDQYNSRVEIYKTVSFDVDYFHIYNTSERKSKEGANFYTLLMNNLDSWKKYPKRQQICSYNFPWNDSRSEHIYRVIPFNNSKWGVAPKADVWDCDSGLSRNAEVRFGNMKHLFHTYDEADFYHKITDSSWDEFLIGIFEAQMDNFDDYASKWSSILRIPKSKIKDLLGYIEKNFTPKKANFKLTEYKKMHKLPVAKFDAKEVWTDSPCLYIRERLFEDIKQKLINMK